MACHLAMHPYRVMREARIKLDSLQLVSCAQAQQSETLKVALLEPVQECRRSQCRYRAM
jgi:hypothetical protein